MDTGTGHVTAVDHKLILGRVYPAGVWHGGPDRKGRAQEEIEGRTASKPMQQSFVGREDRVLMKLIVSKATRVVLGCHTWPRAGEMIQMAGIAIKMGATKEDFDRTVAAPNRSEELVTMRVPSRTAHYDVRATT